MVRTPVVPRIIAVPATTQSGIVAIRVTSKPWIAAAAIAPPTVGVKAVGVAPVVDGIRVPGIPRARLAIAAAGRIVDAGAADGEVGRPVAAARTDRDLRPVPHFRRRKRAPCHGIVVLIEIHNGGAPVLARRSGRPAPTVGPVKPGAVVRRRPAPGLVVDPRPAERLYPHPVAFVIRPPAGPPHVRAPDRPVMGIVPPVAVDIQVVGDEGDVARQKLAMIAVQIPVLASVQAPVPVVERIVRRQVSHASSAQRLRRLQARSAPLKPRHSARGKGGDSGRNQLDSCPFVPNALLRQCRFVPANLEDVTD